MGMTPQEIQEKHFHDTFRGYSHEEVDLFLDEVAVAFERLYRENQSFMRRVVDLEEQLKRVQEGASFQPARAQEGIEEDAGVTESTLKRMLLIAQETADRAVQEARQRAREIQEQARTRADEMMEHAERRVRELSSQRMEKEKELERAKEALRRFDQQYRASFRVFIESQLEALKDLPASPAGSLTEAPAEPSPVFEVPAQPMGAFPDNPESGSMGMETMAMPAQPAMGEVLSEPQEAGDAAQSEPLDFQHPVEPSASGEGPSGDFASMGAEGEAPDSLGDDDPELVRTPKSTQKGGGPAASGRIDEEEPGQSGPSSQNRSSADRKQAPDAKPADNRDAEEDRLIRELFWGDED